MAKKSGKAKAGKMKKSSKFKAKKPLKIKAKKAAKSPKFKAKKSKPKASKSLKPKSVKKAKITRIIAKKTHKIAKKAGKNEISVRLKTFKTQGFGGGRPKIATAEDPRPVIKSFPGGKKAVFLDRDGVINEYKPFYVKNVDDFWFIPGAIRGMKMLCKDGYHLFIVSNQSGIARGHLHPEKLAEIDKYMQEEFARNGIKVEKVYYCTHHPDEKCNCRKPKTTFVADAALEFHLDLKQSYVIGDNTHDVKMGHDAGCMTVLVKTGLGGKDKNYNVKPDMKSENLLEAAKEITGYDE